tara:strand:- start:111 stop:812 length:702 start_codon:yes stop_codon:yes gene_type:complete
MKVAIIVFPGSNRERDMVMAIKSSLGAPPIEIWHANSDLPKVDLIVLPGGFSYGDYLRSGAMAANSRIIKEVKKQAKKGVHILGICNGFQILTETGLLPGALMRNANLKFICKDVNLKVERTNTVFANCYKSKEVIRIPVAHHDGNYFADDDTLKMLEGEGRIGFRYCGSDGKIDITNNLNGSCNNIAGLYNDRGNILGMMPHPENAVESMLGGTDGKQLFDSIFAGLGRLSV